MTRRSIVLCLLVLVPLAGCGAFPANGNATTTPGPPSLSVSLANDHDESYRVRIRAIPPSADGMRVTYVNGSTRTFESVAFGDLPRTALANASDVEPLGTDAPVEEYRLAHGSAIGDALAGLPQNTTVAFFVYEGPGNESLRNSGLVQCGGGAHLTELDVRIDADGTLYSAVACTD